MLCCPVLLLFLQAAGTKWSSAIETQLCYEVKTFLLAGHETSAAMLMWSVYELSRHPQQREKVRGACGWVKQCRGSSSELHHDGLSCMLWYEVSRHPRQQEKVRDARQQRERFAVTVAGSCSCSM
jgi:cytochrome P450